MNRQPTTLLTLCLGVVFLFAGCSRFRDESSRFLSPPIDPVRQEYRQQLATLLEQPELQIGMKTQDYFIGPGDVLAISLVGRPDILGETIQGRSDKFTVTVTENPVITLPLVGAIKVHGKTSDQLQEELRIAYSQYILEPTPIVTIDKFFLNQVSVLGTVKTSGRYPLEYGDTVLNAIFKAGGLTFGAATGGPPPARYLKVYRDKLNNKERQDLTLEQLVERLKEGDRILPREEIIIPIEEFILNGNLAYNIPLKQNDIVYIPPAGAVMATGWIKRPGVVFLGPSLRTVGHVMEERGTIRFGAASKIEVVRTHPDGTQESFFMNAREIRSRSREDFFLQDGDQIHFYRNGPRSWLEAFSKLLQATAQTGINATYSPI